MAGRWYVSFHGGDGAHALNNLHVFSPEGEPVGTALDRDGLPKHVALREVRGFAVGPDGDLYVANANKEQSQILRFGGHPDAAGKHPFVAVVAERRAAGGEAHPHSGLAHPFDVAFGPDGNLYVPNQDTGIVARYAGPGTAAPGAPLPHPPALSDYPPGTFHPGTFVPSAHRVSTGLRAVRGAVFGPSGDLFVADRAAGSVKRYHGTTGELLGELGSRLAAPIHLLFRPDGRTLLVGSRDGDAVLACDTETGEVAVLVPAGAGGLREPAGLAFGDDGFLYVASRGSRQVLRFDAANGRPDSRPFIDGLADHPEFVLRVDARR